MNNCRYAFCAEYGGNLWRMLLFGEQLQERHVPHFPGAEIWKWFEELEEGGFRLIKDEQKLEVEKKLGISLQLDGLDRHICLKIRLPVLLISSPRSFGFIQNFLSNPFAKFVSAIDTSIQGNILFDIAHIEQNNCVAFVSLKSFNSPAVAGDYNYRNTQWSICSPKDLIGQGEGEQEIAHQGQQNRNQLTKEDKERFKAIFICWKIENGFTTFARFNAEDRTNNIKLANNQLKDTELGEWYNIEYCRQNEAITLLGIHPADDSEKTFKTRVDKDGTVQFEIFIRRRDYGFESYSGTNQVIRLPVNLQQKQGLICWCTLEENPDSDVNVFVFNEEINNACQSSSQDIPIKIVPIMADSIKVKAQKIGGFGGGKPRRDQLLTNLAMVDGKYSDLKTIDRSIAISQEEEKKTDEINKMYNFVEVEELDRNKMDGMDNLKELAATDEMTKMEELDAEETEEIDETIFEDEIPIPEHLIDAFLIEESIVASWDFDCTLGRSTDSLNAIRIEGTSKDLVKECAKRIKNLRNIMILEDKKKMEMPSLEESSEEMSQNEENDDKAAIEKIFEWHSQQTGDWVDMLDEQEEQSNELTKEMPSSTKSTGNDLEIPNQNTQSSSQQISICRNDANKGTHVSDAFTTLSPSSSPPRKKPAFSSYYASKVIQVPKKYHPNVIGKDANNLKQLEEKFNVKIEIPPKLWPDEEITIFGNELNNICNCKENILEMVNKMEKESFVHDFVPIPIGDPKHVHVDYIKANFPSVKIEMPYPERGDKPAIRLFGLREEVEHVKKHFEEEIEKFKNHIEIFIRVEEKHYEKFLGMEGKLMKEFKKQHPECTFYLNQNENRMEIRGILKHTERAKETIVGILATEDDRPVVIPEISRVLRQYDINEDALVEMMQQLAGGSKQNCFLTD